MGALLCRKELHRQGPYMGLAHPCWTRIRMLMDGERSVLMRLSDSL